MRQDIIDFLFNLSKSITQGFIEERKREIEDDIEENIEKFIKKFFVSGMSMIIIGTGIFLISWGISSIIDKIFDMQGFGFVIIGLFVIMAGALIYKR